MRRVLITFGGSAYDSTTARVVATAKQAGADDAWVYDDRWLMGTEFYRQNQWLWSFPATDDPLRKSRGFGWFCWKPFIIMDALSRLNDGDVVLYLDADTYPIAEFGMLFDECARIGGQMMFAAQFCANYQWIKRDCLIVMGQDEERYWQGQHAVARFMLFQKGPWRPQQFLMEWLAYCLNPTAQTFEPSTLAPEHLPERFVQHRTEQAIMTLLCLKYGLKLYREACQFGEGSQDDRDLYPRLFHQVEASGPRSNEGSRFRNVPERNQ